MATDQNGGYMDRNTGIGPIGWDVPSYPTFVRMTQFSDPSNTLAFAEDLAAERWPARRRTVSGSTLINCDNWKFAGRVVGDGSTLPNARRRRT